MSTKRLAMYEIQRRMLSNLLMRRELLQFNANLSGCRFVGEILTDVLETVVSDVCKEGSEDLHQSLLGEYRDLNCEYTELAKEIALEKMQTVLNVQKR